MYHWCNGTINKDKTSEISLPVIAIASIKLMALKKILMFQNIE